MKIVASGCVSNAGPAIGYGNEAKKKRQLAEIKSALSKLDMGNYGICIFCGGEISGERLEVTPEAQTCIRCS